MSPLGLAMNHCASPHTTIAPYSTGRKGFVPHQHKLMVDKALELVAHIESVRGKAREMDIEPGTLARWMKEGGDLAVPLREPGLTRLRSFLARHNALEGLGVPLTYADGLEAGKEQFRKEMVGAVAAFLADLKRRLGSPEDVESLMRALRLDQPPEVDSTRGAG